MVKDEKADDHTRERHYNVNVRIPDWQHKNRCSGSAGFYAEREFLPVQPLIIITLLLAALQK